MSTNIPEETLMNLKQKILCLAIKWNLVEETAIILDSIIPNLKSSKTNILNLNDLCFNAIQENRPEILQLILLRDPNVLNGSFHPLKLYLLYNFKNKVNFSSVYHYYSWYTYNLFIFNYKGTRLKKSSIYCDFQKKESSKRIFI